MRLLVQMSTRQKGISELTRRRFLQIGSLASAAVGLGIRSHGAWGAEPALTAPLKEFGYGDVSMASDEHESQLMNTHSVNS